MPSICYIKIPQGLEKTCKAHQRQGEWSSVCCAGRFWVKFHYNMPNGLGCITRRPRAELRNSSDLILTSTPVFHTPSHHLSMMIVGQSRNSMRQPPQAGSQPPSSAERKPFTWPLTYHVDFLQLRCHCSSCHTHIAVEWSPSPLKCWPYGK